MFKIIKKAISGGEKNSSHHHNHHSHSSNGTMSRNSPSTASTQTSSNAANNYYYDSNTAVLKRDQKGGHQVENDGATYRQPGNFNRSMSPVSAANSSPQSSQSNMMKQQQQAANATAQAAAAAADYFEQQFKAQQHKSQELEQQLCICIDQNKELKETVDNLSELNRKFFEENQQLKERAMSQRDQIDQYHMLFDDNKNEADQLRGELNQVYQRESDLKRQNMQLMSQIQCNESSLVAEVAKLKQNIEQEKSRADLFEKKLKMLEKESNDLLEQERSEKSEVEVRLRCQNDERLKQERLKLEEKFNVERDEFKKQLTDLEHKLEEVIKEKAQLAFKYGQLVETNRDLNSMVKNSQVFNDKKVEETNNKLEFYINKCNELEKEIAECQETHARDTEEWKKFQADLQTAVRVANDFMMEAEEKVNKMKEDYMKVKEREQGYVEEIDRLKIRLGLMETNSRIIQATRQNSTNVESSHKLSSTQLLRASVEADMLSKSQQSTDTDDAKQIMLSSSSSSTSNSQRVRTNSSSSSSTASSLSNQDIMIQPTPNVYKSSTSSANTDALATLVKMYDGVSKRNALIKWCQDRLGDYKGIDIKNFSSSWNDGLAFCALLHSFLPHRIDYDSLRLENNPRKNFLTAFQLAQSLGIEQTLSLNDVLNHERPEWSSIMSYVTLIYKHFHQQQGNHLMPGNNSDEEKANLISSGLGSSSSTSSSSSSSPIRNLHSTTNSCAATSSA